MAQEKVQSGDGTCGDHPIGGISTPRSQGRGHAFGASLRVWIGDAAAKVVVCSVVASGPRRRKAEYLEGGTRTVGCSRRACPAKVFAAPLTTILEQIRRHSDAELHANTLGPARVDTLNRLVC